MYQIKMDPVQLDDEDPFYPETIPPFLSRWMSKVNPKVLLRDMVIPGAHKANSAGLHTPVFAVPFCKCQVEPVYTQLCRGVRFLDFRYGRNTSKNERRILGQDAPEQQKMEQMIIAVHGMAKGGSSNQASSSSTLCARSAASWTSTPASS